MDITFLKLGGSLITDKSKPYTVKLKIIKRLAGEIGFAIRENPNLKLIIGNGAGSFAHQSAAKYNTVQGFDDDESKLGACKVHYDAMKLHAIVLNELLQVNIAAFSISPASFITTKDIFLEPITTALYHGLIPFIYGDVILDGAKGSTVYSTDRLFSEIINNKTDDIKVQMIIHAGNYDGVIDKNNNLVDIITPQNFNSINDNLFEIKQADVTGGMKTKVSEALKLTENDVNTMIINGGVPDNVKNSLLGNPIKGTLITSS